MSDLIGEFIDKKKAESEFVSLEDGESVKVIKLKSIKPVNKAGYDGKEKEVLRFIVDVETSQGVREKSFDNGTQRFAKELQEKGVTIGSSFTLTRTGQQTKTRYTVTDVVKPEAIKATVAAA